MKEMISLEEARELVLSHVSPLPTERVSILDAVGRVAAEDLRSDIDVSPFAHAAMDGFALHAADIEGATEENPVKLSVIAEIGAGSVYAGAIAAGECVRIMTGAQLPDDADAVVKYEIVDVVEGDGRPGSVVAFAAPTAVRSNIREAGEEARAGEVIVEAGEVIGAAGVGFLAGCGVLEVETYRAPRVAIIATGSELVDPSEVPTAGKIRNSNSYAMAACAKAAGAEPFILPIVEDTYEALESAVAGAVESYDFVVTTGGAANGDFDFIKPVVDNLGELYMTTVNMRPGKGADVRAGEGHARVRPSRNPRSGLLRLRADHPRCAAQDAGLLLLRAPRHRRQAVQGREEEGPAPYPHARDRVEGRGGRVRRHAGRRTKARFVRRHPEGQLHGGHVPEGLESKRAGDLVTCYVLDVPEEVVI